MTTLNDKLKTEANSQDPRSLAWENYWAGSERAKHAGGSFLVIHNGQTWTARFDRNGQTEWTHSVLFKTAGKAKLACERRRLLFQ